MIGIGACPAGDDAPTSGRTDDSDPEPTKGGPEGPPLSDVLLNFQDYQVLALQPFVPPVQARVYVPGAVFDFVMRNTPVEFEVDDSV